MWSWGVGLALGLGWGGGDPWQLLPKVIEELPPGASVLRIAACRSMAACVRADGTTLSWGRFCAGARGELRLSAAAAEGDRRVASDVGRIPIDEERAIANSSGSAAVKGI